jgi:nitrogenase-stabilizing/protective protein
VDALRLSTHQRHNDQEQTMTHFDLDLDLEDLSSAEDFLNYFDVPYDQSVVHVNRLHILQRFHDYLAQVEEEPRDPIERRALYADLLLGAYQDFVSSDARTEKVFRVFRMNEPRTATVALSDLTGQIGSAT